MNRPAAHDVESILRDGKVVELAPESVELPSGGDGSTPPATGR